MKLKIGKGEGEDLHKGTVKNREKTLTEVIVQMLF